MEHGKSRRIRALILSAVMLAVGAALFALASWQRPAPSSAADAPTQTYTLTILQVNDTHGQLGGLTVEGRQVGGAARMATAIKTIRANTTADRLLLVHCGDVFSRGDALTNRSKGAANIAVMNQMGYDMWVPGNGEYYGGLGVLRRRITEAKFPTLAANITVDGRPLAPSHAYVQVGPATVALFGLSLVRDDTEALIGVEEADPIETAAELVPQLRRKADAVVALTHIGLPEDVRLAAAVEGIDLILGAHTHSVLQHGFRAKGPDGREVLICQAGDQYRYLGQVDMTLSSRPDGTGFAVSDLQVKLIPIDEDVPPDPEVEALLAELSDAYMPPPFLPVATPPATAPASMPTSAPAAETQPVASRPAASQPVETLTDIPAIW